MTNCSFDDTRFDLLLAILSTSDVLRYTSIAAQVKD